MMNYNAALYCRVSRDDDKTGESASIETQKRMLKSYAEEQGFPVFGFYIDDGFSGTDFNRPSFKRMTADIKSGKVNLVITKDLSRLGRNYIVSGELIEKFFPLYKTRYIALNDCYDSDNDNTKDLVAIRNVMNELYAGDISRKIKSALLTKMKEGKFVGSFAPYGYLKSAEDKNKLIINEQTACTVRTVFRLASEGFRPTDIAKHLNEKGVLTPSAYRLYSSHDCNTSLPEIGAFWRSGTIQKILKNEVYIGNSVQHKTSKVSFKEKKSVYNSREDYITVKSTHDAIIDSITFAKVQKQVTRRKSNQNTGFNNIFSGIVLCGDCNAFMSVSGSRKLADYRLVCGKYKLHGRQICSNHSIRYDDLCAIIRAEIKRCFTFNTEEKNNLLESLALKNSIKNSETKQKLLCLNRRKSELNIVIFKVYEDKYLKKISEERAANLIKQYENALKDIESEIDGLGDRFENNTACNKIINAFDCNFEKFDSNILMSLVDKIIIFQGEYSGKDKKQSIEIYFTFSS